MYVKQCVLDISYIIFHATVPEFTKLALQSSQSLTHQTMAIEKSNSEIIIR